MRALIGAVVATVVATTAQAQQWGYPYHEQINSLMERSSSFRTEVEGILPAVIVNTHESLPGDNLVLMVPGNGNVTLYFDVEKIKRINVTSEELDVILVHELYGHAVPSLRDGKVCDDPRDGEYYIQSCVGRREARVLRELGIRPRTTYGLR